MKLVFIINRSRFLLNNAALISDQYDGSAAQMLSQATFVFKVLDTVVCERHT